MTFEAYIAIDWSGDRAPWQAGLQVAVAFPGRAAPRLLRGPGPGGRWSRDTVLAWIGEACRRGRALIGLDFAFGFPSLPDLPHRGGPELWREIEAHCGPDANLYGGRFFAASTPEHRFSDHVFGRERKGARFDRALRRATEAAAARVAGATPSSPLLAIGPAQVGPSTVSGMRALLRLSDGDAPRPVIWPFGPDDGRSSVVVEAFPRFYPLSRGCRPQMREHEALNLALAAFGSEPVPVAPRSEDEGDALVTAAALRALPSPVAALPEAASREGWIYGVPPLPERAA